MPLTRPRIRCCTYLFSTMLFLLLTPAVSAAEAKCEWVGDPASVTTYSGWTLTTPGTVWNTYTRTCETTWTGPSVWYTEISSRSCTPGFGIGIGRGGPSGTVGATYPKNITRTAITTGTGTATRKLRQESCLWTSSTVVGLTETFNETRFTHQGLYNDWADSTVMFDGQLVAFGDAVDLNAAGEGMHKYTVSRTDGTNTDLLEFNINVVPSYSMAMIDKGNTVNPSAKVRFFNHSPDDIFVDISSLALDIGMETALYDNQHLVPAGSSADVLVDFYTQDGYVVPPGQAVQAEIFARIQGPEGDLLASTIASVVPTPVAGLAALPMLGLLAARRRRRQG